MRMLEPVAESAQASADREQEPRCVRCATRGE
jgi:hypothetical protein